MNRRRTLASLIVCGGLVCVLLMAGLVGAPAPSAHRTPADLLSEPELRRLSTYQRAIVQDGEITFDEYRRAIEATVACARGGGALVDDPEMQADGTLSYSVGVAPGAAPEAVTAHSRCASLYSDEVSVLWATRFAGDRR